MANEHNWQDIPHKVGLRNERRMLIEVDVEPAGTEVAGQWLLRGKHKVLIYKSEFAMLQARTQTDDHRAEWASSERRYRQALAQHLGRIKDPEARKRAEDDFGPSVSSFFAEAFPNGMPPLRSLRVLVDDVPPPETPANISANQMSELARVLGQLISGGQAQQQKAAR